MVFLSTQIVVNENEISLAVKSMAKQGLASHIINTLQW